MEAALPSPDPDPAAGYFRRQRLSILSVPDFARLQVGMRERGIWI